MRRISLESRPLATAALALLVLAGCRGSSGLASSPPVPVADAQWNQMPFLQPAHKKKSKIKHVVIIVQENRSLNNLFMGFPGAKTQTYGYDTSGHKMKLQPFGLATKWDLEHNSEGFIAACHGTGKIPGTGCRMNGFNKETCTPVAVCPKGYPMYGYVPKKETAPYWSIAQQYVLADEMYASNFDTSSFVSHQYIIAGQADKTSNYPISDLNWGCPGGPKDTIWQINQDRMDTTQIPVCFNYMTLGDELDAAKKPWAFYTYPVGKPIDKKYACGRKGAESDYGESNGIWSAYQAVEHICQGPDWNKDIITDATRFLTDVKTDLRSVTWITPTCANSDHAGCDSSTGPSWVTSLVNAVGESKFWSTTAIFIFWDDYGGWYDAEPPAYVDYDGLGGRIPMLIVSPYAKKGYVDHTHYEHGTILKFVENTFGLARLNKPNGSDVRANPPNDSFDFSQSPRKFTPIKAPLDANYFMHQPPDFRPPDTN